MGHEAPAGGLASVDVAVCTIEKGNSLVNRLLQEGRLNTLGKSSCYNISTNSLVPNFRMCVKFPDLLHLSKSLWLLVRS